MDSIRSNLNGIANTHRFDRLRTLRQRITTCFHSWQAKPFEKPAQQNERQSNQRRHQQQQQNQQQEQINEDYFEFSKANTSLRSLNRKLRKLINKRYTNCSDNSNDSNNSSNSAQVTIAEPEEQEQQQHTIQFLSSTLIEDDTLDNLSNSITHVPDALQQDQHMPISENLNRITLHDDYPDLAAEVRGILLARAQNGATIADIKDDYCKNTGRNFPVLTHITEFLLSIPQVSAICMENGTRIFCVIPTEKTEHLYNLIIQQRQSKIQQPQSFHYNHPTYQRPHTRYYGTEQQQHRQYQHRPMQMPNYPRTSTGSSSNYSYPRSGLSSNSNNCICKTEATMSGMCNGMETAENQNLMAPVQTDSYQDNCNHLYSRLYYQHQLNFPSNTEMQFIPRNHNRSRNNYNQNHNTSNNNNFVDYADSNNGNIVYNDNPEHVQQHIQPLVQEPSEEQFIRHEIKIPSHNSMNNRNNYMNKYPAVTRLSSPTNTRSSQGYGSQSDSTDSENEAHLYDFSLLGDDFFLYMARMELRCKFKKNQRILQSGLCVSGQTIPAAIKRIHEMIDCNKSIIINIGSVDIMQGKSLIQIEHDLRELIKVMRSRGHTPILTTLAPLANYSHDKKIKENLQRFNEYIKRQKHQIQVIDIWSCLVSDKQQTLFDCFQNEPRIVSGAAEPYVFWNKIGRQRVLKLIESAIEY